MAHRARRLLAALVIGLVCAPGPLSAGSPGGVVVPLVFYTPETGVAGGATAVAFRQRTLTTGAEGSDTLSLVGFYTAERQYLAAVSGRAYFADGRWLVANSTTLSEFPRDYYGQGRLSSEADEESYTPLRRSNSLRLQRWIGGPWYAGVRWDAGRYDLEDVEAGGEVEAYYEDRRLPEENRLHGLGAVLSQDTRSGPFFPTAGSRTELAAVAFPEGFGADQSFSTLELDHRHYLGIGERHAVALQFVGEYAGDDAPLPFQPRLGGTSLRGFYEGRYTDNVLLAGQAEWRFPIARRWQGAAFVGAGEVFPSLSDASTEHLKYGLGGGLRYVLVPDAGIHLRLDFARGYARGAAEDGDGLAVYFNLGEAF
ncbi:BamA/TamA family outer membrane protein [Halorhodospira halophila]|uniref:Surface antigen (D15) n=1 Tax=Halorhodospira halophila (strain DSM 244 / SL1) TaxID=349124 RepID=A1WXF1_HALHL|nr:BamA/TamA family outer membrane protein [Halorhodospira halophila]ABM62363.1 surface antigen (D15) [Halorhodospira halophila SL1]MBK1730094.1 hypothetical protein [Halorhodospira halophila]